MFSRFRIATYRNFRLGLSNVNFNILTSILWIQFQYKNRYQKYPPEGYVSVQVVGKNIGRSARGGAGEDEHSKCKITLQVKSFHQDKRRSR